MVITGIECLLETSKHILAVFIIKNLEDLLNKLFNFQASFILGHLGVTSVLVQPLLILFQLLNEDLDGLLEVVSFLLKLLDAAVITPFHRLQAIRADHHKCRATFSPMPFHGGLRRKQQVLLSDIGVCCPLLTASHLCAAGFSKARFPVELSTVLSASFIAVNIARRLFISFVLCVALLSIGQMIDPTLVLSLTHCIL